MNKPFRTGLIIIAVLAVATGIYFYESSKNKALSDKAKVSSSNDISITESPIPTAEISTSTSVTISPTVMNDINDGKLKIEDLKIGTGAEAVLGKSVTVNYKGTLSDGTQFDSSYDRGTPFTFNLGGGDVIQGWDQGVVGMKVGGKRRLTIPASLGYGDRAVGSIPANSTLIFEIELLKVE